MTDDQKILNERAKKIRGHRGDIKPETGESIQVVAFLLNRERYGVENSCVTEVIHLKNLTIIPGTPPFVTGVINVRGKIISLVNLKLFFNLPPDGLTQLNRVIILKKDKMEFGIVTDAIEQTHLVRQSALSPPPVTLNGIGAGFIKGITPDGLIVLDADRILSENAIIVNQK